MKRILVLGLLALVGLLAACDETTVSEQEKATRSDSNTISVASLAQLDVDNSVGSVIIEAGAAGQVAVDYTLTAYAETQEKAEDELDDLRVDLAADGDTVRITTFAPEIEGERSSSQFELRIAVPPGAGIDVQQNVGSVHIIDAQPNQLTVDNNVGDIIVRGALPLAAGSMISNDVGSITVELSGEPFLYIDAEVNTGEISVSDFATRRVDNERDVVSEFWRGDVGAGDGAPPQFRLRVDVGDILVRAR